MLGLFTMLDQMVHTERFGQGFAKYVRQRIVPADNGVHSLDEV